MYHGKKYIKNSNRFIFQNSNGFIYSSDISKMNHMVLSWVIVLKGIHVLIPRNMLLYMTGLWGCKLKILSWGDYPALSRYVINVIMYVLRRGRERDACMALLVGRLTLDFFLGHNLNHLWDQASIGLCSGLGACLGFSFSLPLTPPSYSQHTWAYPLSLKIKKEAEEHLT